MRKKTNKYIIISISIKKLRTQKKNQIYIGTRGKGASYRRACSKPGILEEKHKTGFIRKRFAENYSKL